MTDFQALLSNPSRDLIVVFFFVAAGFFYGLASGKSRLAAVLLATYLSAFIFENLRFLDFWVKDRSVLEVFFIRAASFFAVLILAAFILSRLVRRDGDDKTWPRIFLLSFLEVGFIFSLMFRLLPARALFTFSPVVENLFAGETAFFWWLILPLVALWIIFR